MNELSILGVVLGFVIMLHAFLSLKVAALQREVDWLRQSISQGYRCRCRSETEAPEPSLVEL